MRLTRDQLFMDIAHVVAKRSTCFRLNVGAVIVVDNSIVSIGYNGAPSGHSHCAGNSCAGITPGSCPTIHAEVNAILRVTDSVAYSLDTRATLYVTEAPCVACATWITHNTWIRRVVFARPYRDDCGTQLLLRNKVHVDQITPAGYVVSQATGLVQSPDA